MSIASQSPTRQATPNPEFITQTSASPPLDTEGQSSTAAGRAFQHGLDKGNLEQEVGQVLGTLNSWWGGVKKQSVSALSSLKADLDKTVTQAQADLDHLRTAKVEIVRKDNATFEAEQAADREKAAREKVTQEKGKEKVVDLTSDEPGSNEAATAFAPSAAAFLDRLSSSTSQLQHTLQSTIQNTLASAATNPAISNPSQIRTQLAENLRLSSARQNLQLSMKQAEKVAEEYMKKGDQWVKDAEKWMGDAVKVVPPDSDNVRHVGMSWDGSDFYAFSTSASPPKPEAVRGESTQESVGQLRSPAVPGSMARSRKEAMLGRLRESKDLLLIDPASEIQSEERRLAFKTWISDHWDEDGSRSREQEEGHVGGIRMLLVPEYLSDEQFWQRYLFHKHMIEAEDSRRKRLLEVTEQAQPDDFSWDDEEEITLPHAAEDISTSDPTTTPRPVDESKLAQQTVAPAQPIKVNTSTSTSPRDSEESYDLVSDQGGRISKPAPPVDNGDDSDWE